MVIEIGMLNGVGDRLADGQHNVVGLAYRLGPFSSASQPRIRGRETKITIGPVGNAPVC